MPGLIVSSHYSNDSRLLRRTAQQLGWETLRLEGRRIPDDFDPPDDQIALFASPPHAFEIAHQLGRTLLGCDHGWTVGLPAGFLGRRIRQTTLREALEMPGESFVKHALRKAFRAAVYDSRSLADATANLAPGTLVHVAEPVRWAVEYRCFVLDRTLAAISPYQRHGRIAEDDAPALDAPDAELSAAGDFCRCALQSPAVAGPPAFVLDVGLIEDRGWAVVECNPCWASAIYGCDPQSVLRTLLRACVASHTLSDEQRRWDYEKHYHGACA